MNDVQSQKDSKFVKFEAENKEIKKVTVAVNNEKVIEEENMVAKKNISNIDKTNEVSAVANERDPETEMVLKSKGNSWVEYELYRKYRNAREFTKARVFYANAKASSIEYSINGKKSEKATLSSGRGLQELVIDAGGSANKLKLEFARRVT